MTTLNTQGFSKEASAFLTALLAGRCNLLVSGDLLVDKGLGLDYLESLIAGEPRVLRLDSRQDTVQPDTEDWIEQAATAQAEYVIVSHWQKKDVLDLLRLVKSGKGIMATVHATSARGALETFDLIAADVAPHLTLAAVRSYVAAGFSSVVHCARLEDGTTTIDRISEVQGMEVDVIVMQDIFWPEVIEGRRALRPTGIQPNLLRTLEAQGIDLPVTTFGAGRLISRLTAAKEP